MPIEIKELHIHVTVDASSEAPTSVTTGGSTAGTNGATAESDKDAIVAECVEQVLQILQNKRER